MFRMTLAGCLMLGVLAAVLAGLPLDQAKAWGAAGHSIVAEIAQRRLLPEVAAHLRLFLGGEISLASLGSWADSVALIRPDTYGLHFVNIPFDAIAYQPERDCRPGPRGDCVIAAITRYEAILTDRREPMPRRQEALKFLIHFVADVHEPMHCIDRKGDGGGSLLPVTFFGTPTTLHLVWDVGIIERHTYDWGSYVNELQAWLETQPLDRLVQGSPADWAWQAHELAVTVAYGAAGSGVLGEDYFHRSLPVVSHQLALAGLRLAVILNRDFADP